MRKQVRQGCCGYLLCSHSPQSDVSDLKQVISISEVSLLNNTVHVTPYFPTVTLTLSAAPPGKMFLTTAPLFRLPEMPKPKPAPSLRSSIT